MSSHGTNASYRKGCRCDDCKRAHATYVRERLHARGVHLPMSVYLLHRRDGLAS